ncbi:nuclear transport factor 2 family protein [Persicitalea jodogahamensis]|uniref:Ketosteroid isomerase n=1 Tax=Persicitalea jodogahamensis TaxID=402147 RepID=A0A8J3D3R3_9BACT|nr:nuclear transport factor 2 family protein [Persicitalea jodogahamensis]GHB68122.1 ketosteroid isomerase [Persicitalea jodogahamensis]
MDNKTLIEKFYGSFARADAEGMASCYAPDVVFTDPAFGELRGDEVATMWRMLIKNSKGNLAVSVDSIEANETTGSAHWVADYVFSQTGRKVRNSVTARFEFSNGLITRHTDHFDFWKWTRQALGLPGYLLGWTPFMRNKIQ